MGSCMAKEETPRRVLVLHGDGLNAELLEFQFEKLTNELDRTGIELVFVDGWEETVAGAGIRTQKNKKYFRFFKWNENKEYENAQKALDYTEGILREKGPFGGVIGFSQGGGVCTLLAAKQQASPGGKIPGLSHKLQCAVVMGAPQFLNVKESPAKELLGEDGQCPLKIPSMHVIGETDNFKPDIDNMVKLYKNPKVVYHKEGHRPFPADEEEAGKLAREIATFVKQHTLH